GRVVHFRFREIVVQPSESADLLVGVPGSSARQTDRLIRVSEGEHWQIPAVDLDHGEVRFAMDRTEPRARVPSPGHWTATGCALAGQSAGASVEGADRSGR